MEAELDNQHQEGIGSFKTNASRCQDHYVHASTQMGLGGSQKVPAVDKSRKVVNQKLASQGRFLEGQVYPRVI